MNKSITYILGAIALLFIGYTAYIDSRPKYFDSRFNEVRSDIGLIEIKKEWHMHNDKNAVYQKWTHNNSNEIGFFSKYVSCDIWNKEIVAENDNYIVEVDSQKVILSYLYDYKASYNKRSFYLKEIDMPFNTDLFGHSGILIRQITSNEAKEILKENDLKINWP